MALLNTTDAPAKVNPRTAKTPAELHKQLSAREDALLTMLDNLASIAQAALTAGNENAATDALSQARTAKAELYEIQSMHNKEK